MIPQLQRFLRPSSLEQQLTRQLLLGLSITLFVLVTIVHFSVQKLTSEFVLSRLQHDVDSIVAALAQTSDGGWQVDESRIGSVYQRPFSGHYFRIWSEGYDFRSRSLWDIKLPQQSGFVSAKAGKPVVRHLDGPKDQEWLTVTTSFSKAEQSFQVWIAEDVRPMLILQLRFELGVILVFVCAIPLLLILQRGIIKRNFTVFNGIHSAIQAMHQGESLQFPTDVPDEVSDLVKEIENTLRRSSKQLQRSRTAVGNLAHELKRPLQNLRWFTEHSDHSQVLELKQLYDQLQTLITRELRRAAISGNPTPGKRFIPKDDLPVLETLLSRQHSKQIQLSMRLPENSLPYDRDDMLELIGNLLDNAWRFARSAIVLSIYQDEPSRWVILIEDDGPGLPVEDSARLTQRGVTRDESSVEHQGLGLHICQAVIESYEGQWVMDKAILGGLKIRIELPDLAFEAHLKTQK
jgi:signal transduction histidine kinase